jgi:hypothetical protein
VVLVLTRMGVGEAEKEVMTRLDGFVTTRVVLSVMD